MNKEPENSKYSLYNELRKESERKKKGTQKLIDAVASAIRIKLGPNFHRGQLDEDKKDFLIKLRDSSMENENAILELKVGGCVYEIFVSNYESWTCEGEKADLVYYKFLYKGEDFVSVFCDLNTGRVFNSSPNFRKFENFIKSLLYFGEVS